MKKVAHNAHGTPAGTPIPLHATVTAVYRPRRFAIVPAGFLPFVGSRVRFLAVPVPGHPDRRNFVMDAAGDGSDGLGWDLAGDGDWAEADDLVGVRVVDRGGKS